MTVNNKNPRHYDNGAGNLTTSLYSDSQLHAMRKTLPELLRILGISHPESKSKFPCLHPAHNDRYSPNMDYWAKDNRVHCFECDVVGDALDVAGWHEGISDNDLTGKIHALEKLLGRSFEKRVYNAKL